jgi:hypothetical protein
MAGISYLVRDVDPGKPLPYPMEPRQRLGTYARWIDRGNPSQNTWNAMQYQPSTSYYGSQPMMSQQE